MFIEDEDLKYWIENFYGYGAWKAPVWFIAYEEDGGDTPEEVADKFRYFHKTYSPIAQATLCEIRELYKQVHIRVEGPKASLFNNLHDYRFGSNATLHGIWKNLVAFVQGYRDKPQTDPADYLLKSFAHASSQEAWIKLYPLPSTHNHAWYYSWLNMPQFGFLKSRSLYEDHLYDTRMHTILQQIKQHKPEVVLMYDMNDINTLKRSVQSFFPDAKFSMVKAEKLKIPQHHRADFEGTTLLITTQTPALKHNRIETGFDWYDLGKKVKSEKPK